MSRALNVVLTIALLTVAYAHAGNTSYLEALDRWTDEKIARIQRAKRPAQSEPAPIWSRRCARQGKDNLSLKTDNRQWEIRCIERRVLTV